LDLFFKLFSVVAFLVVFSECLNVKIIAKVIGVAKVAIFPLNAQNQPINEKNCQTSYNAGYLS